MIHIAASNYDSFIDQHMFAVQNPFFIFMDMDSCAQQIRIICTCQGRKKTDIRMRWHHNSHIHTAQTGFFQRIIDALYGGKIGADNPYALTCTMDILQQRPQPPFSQRRAKIGYGMEKEIWG